MVCAPRGSETCVHGLLRPVVERVWLGAAAMVVSSVVGNNDDHQCCRFPSLYVPPHAFLMTDHGQGGVGNPREDRVVETAEEAWADVHVFGSYPCGEFVVVAWGICLVSYPP